MEKILRDRWHQAKDFFVSNRFFRKSKNIFYAIDFGQASIKIVGAASTVSGFLLLDYSLVDVSLSPNTKLQVVAFIRDFVHRLGDMHKEVTLSLSDLETIYVKQLSLPKMPLGELRDAIRWQLASEVPFDSDKSILDFQVVREYGDEEQVKKIDLICVFAQTDSVNMYVSAAAEAGLLPTRISTTAFDYEMVLTHSPHRVGVCAVLDVGSRYAHISFYQNSKLFFMRKLAFSSQVLRNSLMGTLITDAGKIEIDSEKALQIIREMGIPLDENIIWKDNVKGGHIIALMRPIFENLVKEVHRSFDYVSSSLNYEAPRVLCLAGGGSTLKNFKEYLHKELGCPVDFLTIPSLVDTHLMDKNRLAHDSHQIVGVLGAALPGAINLLPLELRAGRYESIVKRYVYPSLLGIGLFLLFSWGLYTSKINAHSRHLRIAKSYLAELNELQTLKQQVDVRKGLQDKLHQHKIPISGMLKFISHTAPMSVLMSELNYSQDAHVMILKGIVLGGEQDLEGVLTDFVKNLETSKFFTDATLVSFKRTLGAGQFEIQCNGAHK